MARTGLRVVVHHPPVAPVTTQEQADLRLVVRLAKWAIGGALIAAFSFGLWVARLQSQVDNIPVIMQDHTEWREVMRDFMLLACAKDSLNITERAVCARYRR